ncbi:Fur-regulated basic protein FbpA [Neobacillus cucumis]|uniref:Fur-regulated basic protein FbpA n=1 Tax=Neobacillus cucumis TaxID=1740721 RepID=A0A2N5HNN2_9BACI|nr:Fur-regulated basic protein FbpA [Neobacillus cucumis]PLS07119.1 Fur-regulated basic protein FbpA [Neobacillus cucumis]
MSELLKEAIQEKRQILMDELLNSGVYKIKNRHLYEMTLSELEKEYFNLGMASPPIQHTYM